MPTIYTHGINVTEQGTAISTPVVAQSGIPFVIGTAPIQSAESPAKVGIPVLCTSWNEAVSHFGYSDTDWKNYTLCEFMYSHFKLYNCQPVIFCNIMDPAKMKENVDAASVAVVDHQAVLPFETINDETLVVKAEAEGDTLTKDTDYGVFYEDGKCIVEVLEDGKAYAAQNLNIAYNKVKPDQVDAKAIATGMESIDLCMSQFGTIPDLICAPGWSHTSTVAAVMAAKADGINGMFRAKALIDIDCSETTDYTAAIAAKASANMVDKTQILCWPMMGLGDYVFHMSTQLAGRIASTDTENGGVPYESPSNKTYQCDRIILADGTEVTMSLTQANILDSNGITTAVNFMGGWVTWGNYNACYPTNTDVKDYFIPVSRMFNWCAGTLIKTFWSYLDKPMNRRLIDTIIDTANIWLNGLVGAGYLLGARVVMDESENTLTNLMAGIIKLHLYLTPPSPAKELDFVLEYDTSYVTEALQAS